MEIHIVAAVAAEQAGILVMEELAPMLAIPLPLVQAEAEEEVVQTLHLQ
jgi:hypothetical protein